MVVASPEYRRRAEGDAGPDEGRGVQWEARLIRDRFYADQDAGLQLVLPVVLPGCSADDLPLWLAPASATHYQVAGYTVAGAEALLRVLTGQPLEIEPGLGAVPYLPPRGTGPAAGWRGRRCARRCVIEAGASGDGQVASAVWLGGSLLCQRQAPLPPRWLSVWGALRLPAAGGGRAGGGGGAAAGRGAVRRCRAAGCWRRWWTGCRRATRWRWC